ncbi:MAG TPA: DNA polymerase III subunit gamma/tau [Dissulfurispiraceae bacterium]|nr:DNA polymerase III subunit gamma/tau [Dissulfurispiraceae bacterium]
MSYLVLARKWRPATFDELTGQGPIAGILKNAIINNKVAHAYIFSGPRGVGKTSTARILAKALNCEHGPTTQPCGKCASCTAITDGSSMDVTEIDGASNTGVDNIRDLRERVRYASYGGGHKIYIIDEAHMLSTAAFNALLKTLEEPPAQVIFVLATTDPKKIPATVLSRCQHLPFRRISTHKIKERLKHISIEENFKIDDSALEMVARAADGSMRDSLTILDQIASFSEDITAGDVKDLLGFTDMETLSNLTSAVIEGNRKGIVDIIAELTESGTDLKTFTKDFLQFMRDLLIARIVDNTNGIMDLSEEESKVIKLLAGRTSEEHLALLLAELIKAEPAIRSALFPRIALEMNLLRLSMMSHFVNIDEAIRMFGKCNPGESNIKQISPPSGLAREPAAKEQRAKAQKNREPEADGKMNHPSPPGPGGPLTDVPVTELWKSVIGKIEHLNAPLASKLQEGNASVSKDGITIVFNGGVSVLAESVKENVKLIQEAVREVAGKSIPVKIETKEMKTPSKADLKGKALDNPIVKEALELFDARIVDIYPINDNEKQ